MPRPVAPAARPTSPPSAAPRARAGIAALGALARRLHAVAPDALCGEAAALLAGALGADRVEVLRAGPDAPRSIAAAGPCAIPIDVGAEAWARALVGGPEPTCAADGVSRLLLCAVSAGGSPEALLAVRARCPETIDADATALTTAVADLLGAALEHHAFEAERERRRVEAERTAERAVRLQAVTAALAAPLAPGDVARVIVEQAIAALGAAAGSVTVRDADGARMEVVHASGYPAATMVQWTHVPLDADTPLGLAALTGEPVPVRSRAERAERFPALRGTASTHPSAIAVPLALETGPVGALGLSFATERAFDAEETAFLMVLGRQCALALRRAGAFARERAQRAAAEAAAARTTRLQALTAALSQALTSDEVTRIVIEAGADSLSADAGNMTLLAADGATLHARHVLDAPASVVARWSAVTLDADDPMAECVRTRTAVTYSTRAERESRWRSPVPVGIQAAIVTPIHVGERALGGYTLAFRYPRTFTEDERGFLQSLGHQAALALERARLYEAERAARLERERLLAVVQDESARLERVLSQFPGAAAVVEGPTHVFRVVSAAYARLIGGREVLGRAFRDAVPELGEGYFALLDRVYATGQAVSGTGARARWGRTGDGAQDERVIDFTYKPLFGLAVDGGAPVVEGVIIFVADETKRYAAEAALRERETGLRLAIDVAALGMWTWHPDGDVVEADARVRELLGYGADEPITRASLIASRIHPDDRATAEDAFRHAADAAADGAYGVQLRVLRPDGSERWASVLGRTEFAGEGAERRAVRTMGTLMDRTARRRAEAERERALADSERARAEAEAANRAKSDFLAVMSHELRTPLNAIGGYVQLLEMELRGPVTDAQRDDLARIGRSQRHLLGLITDLLAFARLESGTLRYDIDAVPAGEAMAAVEALIAPQARARDIGLTVLPAPAGLLVRADAERLRQVLLNLLSNAVKFTDAGGEVRLACDAEGESAVFVVTDTGIGIPADALERIFEPFEQVHGGLTRTHDGTGLGLAISRELARAMGGDLHADSVLGEGSRFTLRLPRERRAVPPRVEPRASAPF